MPDNRRQKLIDLGAEALADALIAVSTYSNKVDDVIDRMIMPQTERIKAVKRKISGLKRSKRFVEWRYARGFADELDMILDEVQSCVVESNEGVKILAAFYETDSSVFYRCDDSSGMIGDVYDRAGKLFVQYAAECDNNKALVDIVLKLMLKDDFGVRDRLLEYTNEFLPVSSIRSMITEFRKRAEAESDNYDKERQLRYAETLAAGMNDAKLFEELRREKDPELKSNSCLNIAEVYFKSGDVETAHEWLKKIPDEETFRRDKVNQLLLKIYKKQNNVKEQEKILRSYFDARPSSYTLNDLLDVVGEDKKDKIVLDKITGILNKDFFDISDIYFMVDLGAIDEAEAHLIKYCEQVDGASYNHLLSLAKSMTEGKRYLFSSILYRSMLISILERGFYKGYSSGAKHLKVLDELAQNINDWKGILDHEGFKEKILEKHGRKTSFWAKYEK